MYLVAISSGEDPGIFNLPDQVFWHWIMKYYFHRSYLTSITFQYFNFSTHSYTNTLMHSYTHSQSHTLNHSLVFLRSNDGVCPFTVSIIKDHVDISQLLLNR